MPLTLYAHLPWCVRKCPYCDFNSHEHDPAGIPRTEYIRALDEDLAQDAGYVGRREVQAIFIGGGTPSLFAPEHIGEFLRGCRGRLNVAGDAEVTLEANPGALDMSRVGELADAGVSRLSLGAQSFDDALLERIGRIHHSGDVRNAASAVAGAGFESWNLDLMYALPGQDVAGALSDLEQAVQCQPPHLSWYQLTLEPNTVFHKKPPEGLPDDDGIVEIETAGAEFLRAAGYVQYEISAWVRGGDGARCRHNLNYWQFGDYLGVGAGAHSKLTLPDGGIFRGKKLRRPDGYLRGVSKSAEFAPIAGHEIALEFMLNALRLIDGVPGEYFAQRTGIELDEIENALFHARALGLLRDDPDRLAPTPQGLRYLNDLLEVFM
ncbi:MAG: radical SAM family heme chaperone HemW [Gammaproteobacteria bacterium AqS3]|nr:radical SAM family heme chaperone HemW [Gammaproteobacteria bacterium AqS3]